MTILRLRFSSCPVVYPVYLLTDLSLVWLGGGPTTNDHAFEGGSGVRFALGLLTNSHLFTVYITARLLGSNSAIDFGRSQAELLARANRILW